MSVRTLYFTRICVLLCAALMLPLGTVAAQEEAALRIKLVINGQLGDKSFFDSAQRGADRIMADFDAQVDTIELGHNPANWETGLDDILADTAAYDMLILGTFPMVDFLAPRVHRYPDKAFVLFDAFVPYDNPDLCVAGCANVYSITYAQNEGAFLAGVYAAAVTTSDLPGTNDAAIIGAVGGQENPVLQDFMLGYKQGACLVNPETTVIIQYAGTWSDPARGKEIALALYEQNADVVFQVAAGTGIGVFEAALEQERYAIGVDSDQALALIETDPEQAQRILTSMLKNVDNSLYRTVELHLEGELPLGETEALGIGEGGVGLAENDIYTEQTPTDVQALVDMARNAVLDGDIEVISVFGEDAASPNATCDDMPPAPDVFTP